MTFTIGMNINWMVEPSSGSGFVIVEAEVIELKISKKNAERVRIVVLSVDAPCMFAVGQKRVLKAAWLRKQIKRFKSRKKKVVAAVTEGLALPSQKAPPLPKAQPRQSPARLKRRHVPKARSAKIYTERERTEFANGCGLKAAQKSTLPKN